MKLINILKEIKVTPPFTFTTIEQLEKHIRLYPVYKQDLVGAVYDAADLANDDSFADIKQDIINGEVYNIEDGTLAIYSDNDNAIGAVLISLEPHEDTSEGSLQFRGNTFYYGLDA
jgi:hypothetical protein